MTEITMAIRVSQALQSLYQALDMLPSRDDCYDGRCAVGEAINILEAKDAPQFGVVAWKIGKEWSSVWHWESEPGRTLCGRLVPPNTPVSRERHGNAPTCTGCEALWKHGRIRLEPNDAA